MFDSNGTQLIARERAEQLITHGYDISHDVQNYGIGNGAGQDNLLAAAICYLMKESNPDRLLPRFWPFAPKFWKPKCLRGEPETWTRENRIKELAKAGALIAAQIDMLLELERRETVNRERINRIGE